MEVRLPEQLESLAIFPLPEMTLFPHALLPLHIFEPRYREMTADALAGSRLLAMTRILPGHERDPLPPVDLVAGVGHIISAERLADGRYHLVLRGLARVHIEEELAPTRRYRQVRARKLVDDGGDPAALAATQQQLVAICDQLARVIPEGGDALRQLVRSVPTPGGCADAVAAALVRGAEARQALLETLDPGERLERVIDAAALLLAEVGPGDLTVN